MKANDPYARAEYKLNVCRFMVVRRANMELLTQWSSTLVKTEFLSLELNFCMGREFNDKIVLKPSMLQEQKEVNSTNPEIIQIDVKMLKSACRSAVVVSMMTLSLPRHRRLLAIMTYLVCPSTSGTVAPARLARVSTTAAISW